MLPSVVIKQHYIHRMRLHCAGGRGGDRVGPHTRLSQCLIANAGKTPNKKNLKEERRKKAEAAKVGGWVGWQYECVINQARSEWADTLFARCRDVAGSEVGGGREGSRQEQGWCSDWQRTAPSSCAARTWLCTLLCCGGVCFVHVCGVVPAAAFRLTRRLGCCGVRRPASHCPKPAGRTFSSPPRFPMSTMCRILATSLDACCLPMCLLGAWPLRFVTCVTTSRVVARLTYGYAVSLDQVRAPTW